MYIGKSIFNVDLYGAKGLIFVLSLHLLPNIVYASSDGSNKTMCLLLGNEISAKLSKDTLLRTYFLCCIFNEKRNKTYHDSFNASAISINPLKT